MPPTTGSRALHLLLNAADERRYTSPWNTHYDNEFMIARWDIPEERLMLFIKWTPQNQYQYRITTPMGIDLKTQDNLTIDEMLDKLDSKLKPRSR